MNKPDEFDIINNIHPMLRSWVKNVFEAYHSTKDPDLKSVAQKELIEIRERLQMFPLEGSGEMWSYEYASAVDRLKRISLKLSVRTPFV